MYIANNWPIRVSDIFDSKENKRESLWSLLNNIHLFFC